MSEFKEVVNEGARSMGKKLKRGLLYFLAIAIVIAAITIWAASWTYSDGTRSGYIIKTTHKGTLIKTYEGQLNTGGFQTDADSGVVGNVWDFSILDDEVYQQLQQLEGQKVTLAYKQRYHSFFWQAKTDYIVKSAKKVPE